MRVEAIHDEAEGRFAVGRADRRIGPVFRLVRIPERLQVAVMREHPLLAA